jgi:hypothetical protein
MSFWIGLWKIVFVAGVSAFALMAVWVTIGGWKDVKDLLRDLKSAREGEEAPRDQGK